MIREWLRQRKRRQRWRKIHALALRLLVSRYASASGDITGEHSISQVGEAKQAAERMLINLGEIDCRD